MMEHVETDGLRLLAESWKRLAVRPVEGRYPVALLDRNHAISEAEGSRP